MDFLIYGKSTRCTLVRDVPWYEMYPILHTCKTFVVATRVRAAGSPVLMQAYDNFPLSESFEATIWQAARATSAAPTFFAPVVIDDVRYADGGTGYNNPADLA